MKNGRGSFGWHCALIVLLTVVAYFPALRCGFVYDDSAFITHNRMLEAGDGLYWFWFTTQAPDYYPLTWSAWWLEWRLWGNSPLGYHAVNVALHAINAVLVWMILRRLKIPGAWLAALVFAVHPVNVATVAWISEQKNTLSMLFYAASILLYLRFDEDAQWRWYWFSLVAFLFALFSKTAVVMLPVVLLGCAWWTRGRIRPRDWLCSMPFFVLSLVMGLATIWFQHYRAMGGHAVRTMGFASRLATAGWVPWFYLYKALLPFNLTINYPKWEIDASRWVSYAPGIALVGCFTLFWWRRKTWGRPLLFGLGYFVVTLFPVLGFLDQGFYRYSLVADHWQYVAIVAPIAGAVAAGVAICHRAYTPSRYVGVLAGAAVLMVLGVATWRRSCVYETDETLWRDTLAKNPQSWLAHTNVGLALWEAGKAQEAFGHYQQALRLKPHYAPAHYNLGLIFWQRGEVQAAIGQWEQAVQSRPDFVHAHNNLGFALLRVGRVQEAVGHLEQALRIDPYIPETYYNLGDALSREGKLQEAAEQYERALQLKPNFADAQINLAWLLATLAPGEGGDPARAVTLAEWACERTGYQMPSYLDTLAVSYAAASRFSDAIRTAQHAIELAAAAGQMQLVGTIQNRLDLYREGQAYHQRQTAVGASPSR